MQSWDIDPQTGDYIMQGGDPQETNSLLVPAYFRTKAKRGTWMYAPDNDWGSDFFTITRRPTVDGNKALESVGLKALQPLINDGRAQSVNVEVVGNRRGASELKTVILDASGRVEVQTFSGLGV